MKVSLVAQAAGMAVALLLARLVWWFLTPIRGTSGSAFALRTFERPGSSVGDKPTQVYFGSVFDEPSVDLSIVVPAYNEEMRLRPMMTQTMKYLAQRRRTQPQFTCEIIIVDDGSRDRTRELTYDLAHEFLRGESAFVEMRLLALPRNQGKGFAVQQGMLHARGRLLLMADADGASEISHLERLESAMREMRGSAESENWQLPLVAIGSRAHLQSEAEATRSFLRNLLMKCFHLYLRVFGVAHVQDTQCGFKLFTRGAAQRIFPSQKLRRWAFDVELLLLAREARIPVREVAIQWQEIDGSKLSVVDASMTMARDILLTRLLHLLRLWPLVPVKEARVMASLSLGLDGRPVAA
ncbi:MAG: hypothetical protein MHM6MM_003309 [Cercozoa sp. M6MM]